jgi:ferric iron reductase protein FhuF
VDVARTTPYGLRPGPVSPWGARRLEPVSDRPQAEVAALIPGAAGLGLVAPSPASWVPAAVLADPGWTSTVLDARARSLGTDDRRVLATVWWYSVSSVLLTPALAGVVTGIPLSARLGDTAVAMSGVHPVAAVSVAPGADTGAELRETIAAVVPVVAQAGGMGERSLWAIATDSLANRLLDLGRAVGDVPRATGLAAGLGAAIGSPLPAPRYEDVAGARFVRRASCCLLYRVPSGSLCTSCPRRLPSERTELLEQVARRS